VLSCCRAGLLPTTSHYPLPRHSTRHASHEGRGCRGSWVLDSLSTFHFPHTPYAITAWSAPHWTPHPGIRHVVALIAYCQQPTSATGTQYSVLPVVSSTMPMPVCPSPVSRLLLVATTSRAYGLRATGIRSPLAAIRAPRSAARQIRGRHSSPFAIMTAPGPRSPSELINAPAVASKRSASFF
jgi:hypothetical protein